jgi:putative nucleotidyltransferase with HDIG domain
MKYGIDETLRQLPAVQTGRGVWQNDFHQFDVLEHTEDFVRHLRRQNLTDDANVIAAGWLHDIGKPVVAKPKLDKQTGQVMEREPGKPYHKFDDHEHVGAEMVRQMDPRLFQELGLNQKKVAELVGCHYLPMKGIKAMRRADGWQAFLQAFKDLNHTLETAAVTKAEVLTMFLADMLAKGTGCTDRDELFAIRDALLNPARTEADLNRIFLMQRPPQ